MCVLTRPSSLNANYKPTDFGHLFYGLRAGGWGAVVTIRDP